MLMDTNDDVRSMYRRRLKEMTGGGSISDDMRSRIDDMRDMAQELIESTDEVCGLIVKKKAKKLEKLGMNEEFATNLAKTYIPKEIATVVNIRRYMYRTNIALYDIQGKGVIKNEDADINDEDRWIQNVGLNLADPDVIKKIYEILYKGISRKVFISGMVGIMLERRGGMFERFTKPQLWCYNAITTLILDLLEGNESFNFGGDKDKEAKKDKKKNLISKKELRAFMKMYSDEKSRDARNNRDTARRISFSNLSDDSYPRVLKAFSAYTRECFDSMWDADIKDPNEHRNNNDKKNNNNGKRDNDNNNRHDRDRNNNKNRH